jgi:hypothetical protein
MCLLSDCYLIHMASNLTWLNKILLLRQFN